MTINKPIDMQRLINRVKHRAFADNMHSSIINNEDIKQAIIYAIKLIQIHSPSIKKRDPIYRLDYTSIKNKKVGFTENPELTSLDIILVPFGIPNKIYTVHQKGERRDIEQELQDIDLILNLEYLLNIKDANLFQKSANTIKFSTNYDIAKIIDGGEQITHNPRNIPTIEPYNKIKLPLITEYEEEFIVVHAADRISSDYRLTAPPNTIEDKMNVALMLRLDNKKTCKKRPYTTEII